MQLESGNWHSGYILEFIRQFKQLKEKYSTPENCEKTMKLKYRELWKNKIETSLRDDADSKFGTYADVNPSYISDHIFYLCFYLRSTSASMLILIRHNYAAEITLRHYTQTFNIYTGVNCL